MLTLMKLWRFDVTHVEQALNVCPPYGSIIKKTNLKIVIHFVDHLECIEVVPHQIKTVKCSIRKLNQVVS